MTRIDHTNHDHPRTPAARAACRKAGAAAPTKNLLDLATIGNGVRFHYIDPATGTTRCGKEQPVFVRKDTIDAVDCRGCASRYGQAHG